MGLAPDKYTCIARILTSDYAEELAVARKHHILAAAASHQTLHLDKPSPVENAGNHQQAGLLKRGTDNRSSV